MKDRPDLILLAEKVAEISRIPENFFSKEKFALNIQSHLMNIYNLRESGSMSSSWSAFHWGRLICSVLHYVNKLGAKEISIAEDYPSARKGYDNAIIDLSTCLTTAYGLKMGIQFCQDIIGYIECLLINEEVDIWGEVDKSLANGCF